MKTKRILNATISIIVMVCFVSCELGWEQEYKNIVTTAEMKKAVSRSIDIQMDSIKPYLEDETVEKINDLEIGENETVGSRVADAIMSEENGQKYLNFTYSVSHYNDVDDVLSAAKGLIDEDSYEDLMDQTEETARGYGYNFDRNSRKLSPLQQKDFLKTSKTLLVRSIVLLTAGIVYACVPNLMIWGKVSAAVGIAVAAGMVAYTIVSLWEFYEYDYTSAEFFDQWLEEVKKIPSAEKIVITSAITIGKSVSESPVVTGIIIAVFGLYNVLEFVRPLLNHYNFNA